LIRTSFPATRSIIDKMFDEIKKSKFVIFVATGHNPNVFFEAGYAVAMNKEVITIADALDRLPFDVRDRRAIVYGADPTSLSDSLSEMLGSLTAVPET
jgi:nucleoside 2-deoxyribosyltransferase